MMQLFLLRLSFIVYLADAVALPSVHAEAHSAAKASGRWWAQVGERVYYAPPASFLGLSQNVSDYYYTMGSKSAIPRSMARNVVGSEGRWHLLHLPQGPSLLQLATRSQSGDRRSSLSQAVRLKSGTVLSTGFPAYALDPSYVHPLGPDGQTLEKAAVARLTPEVPMDYLRKLTSFPTRSYNNAAASDKVEKFLKQELEALGITSCYHNFESSSGKLTNVIGHIPGKLAGSLIVGAHYDSRPYAGAAPGAEDNGSGVASLLAIAKVLKMSKVVPKRSIYFVAFAGEEPGLVGSAHFAQALMQEALPTECTTGAASLLEQSRKRGARRAKDKNAMNRAIIMDEIGWASPKLAKQTVNLESFDVLGKEVMDHLRHASHMHNADTIDVVHNSNPFGSDHMSFLENGMSAALTINGDDEAYPNYHKSTDTIENVNPAYMAKIAKMNLGGVIRMAMA